MIAAVRPTEIMEYGEAWLLEILALYRLPVHCMTRAERPMSEWLNRGYHHLSKEALVSTLTSMFQSGEIDAYHDDDMEKPATLRQFLLALGELDSTMHCGVTQGGGKRWEDLAEPDWSRFFEDVGWDGENVEITAATRDRLIELVSNADVLWQCNMSVAEVSITQFTPWEPLAWKTLPSGYRASVRYEQIPFTPRPREEIMQEHIKNRPRYIEVRTWAKSICGHAYV